MLESANHVSGQLATDAAHVDARAATETIFQISAIGSFEEVRTARRGGLKARRETIAEADDERERRKRQHCYWLLPLDSSSLTSAAEPVCAVTTPAKLTEMVI